MSWLYFQDPNKVRRKDKNICLLLVLSEGAACRIQFIKAPCASPTALFIRQVSVDSTQTAVHHKGLLWVSRHHKSTSRMVTPKRFSAL